MIVNDDCLSYMKTLDNNTVDSLVTDPPAGISFMNKEWDSNRGGSDQWIAWITEILTECLRVLKPGGHGFVWAIPRTSHRTAIALENAGFEIRDVVTHLFGSGFPKSHNIGKKLKDWQGWGTALKPASEHWILVRKPLSEKNMVDNVLKWGVGGINIDDCRIKGGEDYVKNCSRKGDVNKKTGNGVTYGEMIRIEVKAHNQGRFPANLILDEEAGRLLDEQSGVSKGDKRSRRVSITKGMWNKEKIEGLDTPNYNDKGGASRFFYCAKTSKSERGEDNTHPTVKPQKLMQYLIKMITPPKGTVLDPFMGSGSTGIACKTLDFNFIGIEKDLEYYKIAVMRMNNFNKR